MEANTGWTNPSGLVRLVEDAGPRFRSGAFHTFSQHGLSPRLNMLRRTLLVEGDSPWSVAMAWPGIPRPKIARGKPFDGELVFVWDGAATGKSAVLLLELDLSTAPSLAGHSCYFAVKAAVTSAGAGVALMLDRGNGLLALSSDSDATVGQWRTLSTQTTLLEMGVARFGVQVFGGNATALVAAAVVAPIGLHYGSAEE
jgi:hypothetical protein